MRVLGVFLVSLTLGLCLVTVTFALFHALTPKEYPRAQGVPEIVVPGLLRVDPRPKPGKTAPEGKLDQGSERRGRLTLSGRVDAAWRAHEVLLLPRAARLGEALQHRTLLDPDGAFAIDDLPRGDYELRLLDERGSPLSPAVPVPLNADRRIEVPAPDRIGQLAFVVRRRGPDGRRLLSGALLILSRKGKVVGFGLTNSDGELALTGLPRGKLDYRVWVTAGNQVEEWRGTVDLTVRERPIEIEVAR